MVFFTCLKHRIAVGKDVLAFEYQLLKKWRKVLLRKMQLTRTNIALILSIVVFMRFSEIY
jgi:hypothetical protein